MYKRSCTSKLRPHIGSRKVQTFPYDSRAVTVRDATFDVLRRLGLTTIFSNPGSTEVPFLAGLPGDLRFVLALHEGSVVGMAAGSRARARRTLPGAAALDAWPGERGRRARHRAPQPRAAGRDRRPAGPAPPGAGPVPGRAAERARGGVPGLQRAARPRAGRPGRDRPRLPRRHHGRGPGAGDRPDGRLERAPPRAARDARAATAAALRRRRPAGRRRAGGHPRPRRGARDHRRRGQRLRGGLGGAHRARRNAQLPGLPGAVRRRGGLPAGPPAVRRPRPGAAGAPARGA